MLAPWKESYDKPWQWIKKKRHYFANKDPYSQSYDFFPVIIYGCESWTVKKAEHQKMDASELWCWRRLLRVPRRLQGDQTGLSQSKSVLIIHWKDWCWNWSSNTLATWCEKLTHSKRQWCWERLKAGGEGDAKDEMVGWHYRLNAHEFEQSPGLGVDREAWCAAVHGVGQDWATELIVLLSKSLLLIYIMYSHEHLLIPYS